MKLESVTKLDKRNTTTSKNFDNDVMTANCDVIVIFPINGQFETIRKSSSGRMVCKTYFLINSNLLSYKNWKQNKKISNTSLILLLWVKVLLLTKKSADISKIRRVLVLKSIFSKTRYRCILTYLRTKFQVFSIIPTSFRQDKRYFTLAPPQNKPLKRPPRLGLIHFGFTECLYMHLLWQVLGRNFRVI